MKFLKCAYPLNNYRQVSVYTHRPYFLRYGISQKAAHCQMYYAKRLYSWHLRYFYMGNLYSEFLKCAYPL